jgi:hypothetical protein
MNAMPGYSIYWDLPVLIVVVSLVYSATRYDEWGAIVREAVRWGLRMSGFLGGIGVTLYALSWWIDSGLGWWVPAAVGGGVAIVFVVGLFVSAKAAPQADPPTDAATALRR